MRNRSAAIVLLLFVLTASTCSRKPKYEFPLVQKYTTQAGDVFYFRPRDGRFVLLERRKALAVAVAPEPDIEAFSFDDKIEVARPLPPPQSEMLENKTFLEKVSAQQVLAMTGDGRILAGGDANGVVSLWRIADGNLELQLNEPSAVLSLAFSPDGNSLAVGLAKPLGDPADTLRLYDIHANAAHRSVGRNAVQALAWSPDGRWYAAGLDDGSALVGEANTDHEPRRIVLSTSAVTALDFYPSEFFLASAHVDKRVLLSKLPTGERLFTFEPALPPNPLFPRVVERVAFDETGSRMAAAYADGEMRIWDTSSLGPITKH